MGFAALGGASLALGDNRFTVACEEEAPEPHAEGLAAVPEDEENFLEDSEFRYAGYTGRVGRVLATTAKAVGTKVRWVGCCSSPVHRAASRQHQKDTCVPELAYVTPHLDCLVVFEPH